MTKQLRPRACALVAATAIAASGCVINLGADQVVVREEKRFTVSPGAEVTLDTFDGSIQVQSWDQPEVRVEIEKRGPDQETAASLEARTSQEGNRVRVEAPAPKVSRSFGIGNVGVSVGFIVRVPQNVKLTAVTRDGSILVANVKGTTNLRSGDGSIRARDLEGDLTARTEDGSLTLENANGRVSLESGDGSIRVDGRLDDLHVRTGDGSITIEADEGSAMQTDWDVSTGDGSITVRVPQNFSAEIDADSRDGRVTSDFDGLEGTHGDNDRGTLRGRIGGGGHKLTLRSGDGSIAIGSR
jgi:DUF4097 and DUF4098 domain-containing protein YvlB